MRASSGRVGGHALSSDKCRIGFGPTEVAESKAHKEVDLQKEEPSHQ